MTKQTITSIIITILSIIGLLFLIYWKPNKQSIVAPPETIKDSGNELITLFPVMIDVSEDSYLLGVGGSYPQFPQAPKVFNELITKVVMDEIISFKEDAASDYKARLETGGDAFKKEFEKGASPYSFSIDTQIIQSNENYISSTVQFSGYVGGAHGFQNSIAFNYDVKNKKILSITDFKSLDQVSEQSRLSIKKQFQEKGVYDTAMQSWIDEGTDPIKSENFNVFTFTNNTLSVYFGAYQVAPYVFGESKVELLR